MRLPCLASAIAALLVAGGCSCGVAAGAPPAAPEASPAAAPAQLVDRHPDLRRLTKTGEVWIDPARKQVLIGAKVVLDKGAIEVFACPERTKEHEALVAIRALAQEVHAALLAIGLEPGRPVRFDPEYVPAQGPKVRITMRWKDPAGKQQECRAQEWIRYTKTGQQLDADWVFAGSILFKDPNDGSEYYQAEGGDLVCVSNFPAATLDLPVESSQSNEALLFEAFEGRVPPRDTDVEMILSAAD